MLGFRPGSSQARFQAPPLSTDTPIMDENATSNTPRGESRPTPYWNPYLAGLLLGGALLASFLILGAGLGASAASIRCGAWLENLLLPSHAQASEFFGQKYLANDANPLRYYLVFMFVGILFGGLLSAVIARRVNIAVERGKSFAATPRIVLALVGGNPQHLDTPGQPGCQLLFLVHMTVLAT